MAAASSNEWQLSVEQREDTIARLAKNLASMTFFSGGSIPDSEALRLAKDFEKKAYTVARVEARTTTGVRPQAETFYAYARCGLACVRLSEHLRTAKDCTRLLLYVASLVPYRHLAQQLLHEWPDYILYTRIREEPIVSQEACLFGPGSV